MAVSALRGSAAATTENFAQPVPILLPPHARECLAQLQSGLDPGQWVERLTPLMSRQAAVLLRRRLALLTECLALPIVAILTYLAPRE